MSEYTFRGTHTILQPTQTAWSEESILRPEPWTRQAACLEVDPEMFFPKSESDGRTPASQIADAVKVCAGCPVADQCLAYALRNREEHGIWGGLTGRQLTRLNRRKDAPSTPRPRSDGINQAQAYLIRKRAAQGMSPKALASVFDVSVDHVRRIIRGDAW